MAASTDLSSLEAKLQQKRRELARLQQQVLKAECVKRSQRGRRAGVKLGSRTRTRLAKAADSSKRESENRPRLAEADDSSKQESGTPKESGAVPSQREQVPPEWPQNSGTGCDKAELSPELSSTSLTAKLSFSPRELSTVESEIENPAVASEPLSQIRSTCTPEQLCLSASDLAGEPVARPSQSRESSHKREVKALSQASSLVRRNLDPHSPMWMEGQSNPAQYLVRQTRSMSAKQGQRTESSIESRCREACTNEDNLANSDNGRRRKKVCEGEKACEVTSEDDRINSVGSKVGIQDSSGVIERKKELYSGKLSSDIITGSNPSAETSTATADQEQVRGSPRAVLDSHRSSGVVGGRTPDDSTCTCEEGFSGNSEMDDWSVSESELCGVGMRKRVGASKSSILSLPPADTHFVGKGFPATNTAAAFSSTHTCRESVLFCHHGNRSSSKCMPSSYSTLTKDPPMTLKVSIPITNSFPITVSQDPPILAQAACSGHSGRLPEAVGVVGVASARESFFPLFSPTGLTQDQRLRLSSDFFLPDDSFQALKLLKLRQQQQALQGGRAVRRRVKARRAEPGCCDSHSSQSEISQSSVLTTSQTSQRGQASQTSQRGQASQTSQSGQASQTRQSGQTSQTRQSGQTSQTRQSFQTSLGTLTARCRHTETEGDNHEHLHSNFLAESELLNRQERSELPSVSSNRDGEIPSARDEGKPRALMACSFTQLAGGSSVENLELQYTASLPCIYEVSSLSTIPQMKPSTAGTAFQNVHKHNLLVMEGGRLAAEGFHIGMCLDGGLRVYTLAAAPGETETANWGNCPRHSWTLGEGEAIHCCCLLSCEGDLLLCTGGKLGDSGVRLYSAGGSSQHVLQLQPCAPVVASSQCSAMPARGSPFSCCQAVCSWLAAAGSPSVITVAAALLPPAGESEVVGMWSTSRVDDLWVQTSYRTLPLPAEMGRVVSLHHVTRHVTHRKAAEGSSDWVVGIRGFTVLLWDATEGTLLQRAALSCGGCVADSPLRARPVGLAAFREENVVFLLIGCQEHDQTQPEGSNKHTHPQGSQECSTQPQGSREEHSQPQGSHEGLTRPQGSTQPQGSHEGRNQPQGNREGHSQPQDTQPQGSQAPSDTISQSVGWLLAVNGCGENEGSGCGYPTHCRIVQTYSYPREIDRKPVATPPVPVYQYCSLSGLPRQLGVALSHDTVLLWDLMHSDPWARISPSGAVSLQSFYWLGDRNHFLTLDHRGNAHVFS